MSRNPPQDLVSEFERGSRRYAEFETRMNELGQRGLVDCKLKLFASRNTTTSSVIATLSNVVRLVNEDKVKPLNLG